MYQNKVSILGKQITHLRDVMCLRQIIRPQYKFSHYKRHTGFRLCVIVTEVASCINVN